MFESLAPVRLVDLAIGWILLETAIVTVRYSLRGRSAAALWCLANSAAGLMLLLAVRAALGDAGVAWFTLCLSGALIAHVAEWMARRRALSGTDPSKEGLQ